eukprot:995247-Prorocentrum_minimum.AAC.1
MQSGDTSYKVSLVDQPNADQLAPGQVFRLQSRGGSARNSANNSRVNSRASSPTKERLSRLARPGQGATYTVDDDDTLVGIAIACGTSVADLKRLNNLQSNTLFAGQKLKLKPRSGVEGFLQDAEDGFARAGDM